MPDDLFISLAGVRQPPRLDEYFGLWSMEGMRFMAGFDRVRSMDLRLHVEQGMTVKRPVAQSLSLETVVKVDDIRNAAGYKETGGYGYPEIPMADAAGGDSRVKVAIIPLSGVLMKQVGSMEDGTSTVMARMDIRHAARNPDVGAILILVDSPGGTVSGTEQLAAEIAAAAAAKPCYAQVEDLSASAAYWAASACTRIFASGPTALIGSIGTYACLYDLSAAATMQGVKAKLYSTGPLKGAGMPGTEITPEQDKYFQAMVDETQTHFAAAISNNRKLSAAKVAELATGAVFHSARAQTLGLIDGIQSVEQTLAMLGAAAIKAQKYTGSRGGMKAELKADGGGCMCTCPECQAGNCSGCSCGGCPSCDDGNCPGCDEETGNSDDSTAGALSAITPKEDAMSDPINEAQNQKGPKAASLQELKAALPKSTAEFREKCLEKNLSIQQSQAAFIDEQQLQIEDMAAKAKIHGVAAVKGRTGDPADAAIDGKATIQARADQLQQTRKLPRAQAWAQACRENPEARKAMVEAHNADHKRKAIEGQY